MSRPETALRTITVDRSLARSGPELRPRFMWLSLVEARQPCIWPAHRHSHYEVILCRQGRYRCVVGNDEIALAPGEGLVVRPGDLHEDRIAPPLTYAAINLLLPGSGPDRSPDLFRPDAPLAARRLRADAEEWWAIAERLDRECHRPAPDGPILDALCLDLLRRVLRAVDPRALQPAWSKGPDLAFAAHLQTVLAAHQGSSAPVAILARACGMGPRAFTAACRAATGLPPAKALLRFRCEQAVRLLHQGLGVAATAERLGFASPFHFSRAFKRHLGEAPSRLR